ncbi:hypothetical protein RTP6_005064 [Batrachochytrium dendrobatidis]
MDIIQQIVFWSFVPSFVTKNTLMAYHYVACRKNTPQQHDPRYKRHYNRAYAIIVTAYLVFTIMQAERNLPANFYNLLNVGIGPYFDQRKLRASYKALSLQYHPDKSGNHNLENVYIMIRQGYDTLKNPLLRQAYDKLGMEAFQCSYCKTERDFLHEAIRNWMTFYAVTAGVSTFFSAIGRMDFGRYWRFSGLLAIAAIEAAWLFSSTDVFPYILPWRTVSQKIQLLRQFFITVSIAISQIGPILFPVDKRPIRQVILDLEQKIDMQTRQAVSFFADAFLPFQNDPKAAGKLQRNMEMRAVHTDSVNTAALSSRNGVSNGTTAVSHSSEE